jgi:hypothetical protein
MMKLKKKKKNKRGIALLFSIMLSAIFLSIALGVSSIALKELTFTSSTRGTNEAFFAADSGVECALYNDKTDSIVFTDKNDTGSISCFGNNLQLVSSAAVDAENFSFNVPNLGSDGSSCAKITVLKLFDTSTVPSTLLSTKITSKGYNLGNSDCDSTATNRIERVLEVNY